MRILEMDLKPPFSYSKWVLQAILLVTVFSKCVLAVQILTPPFSLIVPNFLVFF